MSLPVKPVTRPASLVNAANGRLSPDQLTDVFFVGRGVAKLHPAAARSWAALAGSCKRDTGVDLTVTSLGDAYRSFDHQVRLFTTRFEQVSYSTWLATAPSRRRRWDGRFWRLRSGMALAAVPGTSNHGWGLAVDVALFALGNVMSVQSVKPTWEWLLREADRFGWSWEVQSEPWHVRFCAGDAVPSAVSQWEAQQGIMPVFDPVAGRWGVWPLVPKPNVDVGAVGDVVRYLQGVMLLKAGQMIAVDGRFGPQTATAVRNVKRFFVGQDSSVVDQETWKVVDFLAGL